MADTLFLCRILTNTHNWIGGQFFGSQLHRALSHLWVSNICKLASHVLRGKPRLVLRVVQAWHNSEGKEAKERTEGFLRPRPHFHRILLSAAGHKASLNSRGETVDPTLWWEEWQSQLQWVWIQGGQ